MGISSKFSTSGGEDTSHSKPIARQGLSGAFLPLIQEPIMLSRKGIVDMPSKNAPILATTFQKANSGS